MPQTSIIRNFLTTTQAAHRINVSERTIQHYISKGTLKAEQLEPEKPRSVWIIPLAEIEKYERQHKTN